MSRDNADIVQPCPLQAGGHWIEIELVGEDDQPIPWERYEITLPDRAVRSGFLDHAGKARVDNIPEGGQCLVSFPDLDTAAWDWHGAPAAGAAS